MHRPWTVDPDHQEVPVAPVARTRERFAMGGPPLQIGIDMAQQRRGEYIAQWIAGAKDPDAGVIGERVERNHRHRLSSPSGERGRARRAQHIAGTPAVASGHPDPLRAQRRFERWVRKENPACCNLAGITRCPSIAIRN